MQLLLGSDIGLWVVEFVAPDTVARVITDDPEIARAGRRRGLAISTGLGATRRSLSVHYPRILTAEEINEHGAIYNLHPGYLPWGRGHFPLIWAIKNNEPAGATIHRMVRRVDAGPIVDQTPVRVLPGDTGASLHARIREVERELFIRWWPRLLAREPIPERPQPSGGSYHSKAQFEALLSTDPYSAVPDDLERLRRALTFPGKPGLRSRSDEVEVED